MVELGLYLLGRSALGHVVADFFDFFFRVVHIQEGRWVTQVEVGLLVFALQNFQNAQVAANFLVHGFGEQVNDVRLVLLAIAVHTAIALLEGHQRPWQVKVDQAVAEVVQVQAFAGHIRADQNTDGVVFAAKALDQLLLLNVAHAAVQDFQLLGLEF